jgi:hypothetical protein
MFMSINVVNEDAEEVIRRTLENLDVDEVQPWPGTDLDISSDAGKALLGMLVDSDVKRETRLTCTAGSPNGLGAAYFLLQHHKQLGGAKSINKVKLLTCEDNGGDACLIFFVGPVITPAPVRRAWL